MTTPTEESLAALATVEGDRPPLKNSSSNTARAETSDSKITDEKYFSDSKIILMINYDSTKEPKLSLQHFKYL